MGYDANKHLTDFHNDRVFVDDASLETYRQRRDANRDRLQRGLEENKEPRVKEFVQQGSYSMSTMVKSEVDSSDIDDGAVFDKAALRGANGGDRSALDARKMVCEALSKNNGFKTPPEVRARCVRVYYSDGFHVDIPVYRTYEEHGTIKKELASASEWKASAPEDVTEWFNEQVTSKSPETTNGRQMRRMVRLLKYWSKSRDTWRMPSGFMLSVLCDEAYRTGGWLSRDDLALLEVMRFIKNRTSFNERVYRPVDPRDEITNDITVSHVRTMREELTNAVNELSIIESADCTELKALKALKKVFNTDYWDDRIKELEDNGGGGGGQKSDSSPSRPIDKRGGTGQYA